MTETSAIRPSATSCSRCRQPIECILASRRRAPARSAASAAQCSPVPGRRGAAPAAGARAQRANTKQRNANDTVSVVGRRQTIARTSTTPLATSRMRASNCAAAKFEQSARESATTTTIARPNRFDNVGDAFRVAQHVGDVKESALSHSLASTKDECASTLLRL